MTLLAPPPVDEKQHPVQEESQKNLADATTKVQTRKKLLSCGTPSGRSMSMPQVKKETFYPKRERLSGKIS